MASQLNDDDDDNDDKGEGDALCVDKTAAKKKRNDCGIVR